MTASVASPREDVRSYAPVLAALFVLWPVMAIGGGQGFLMLLMLAGLAALALARPRLPPAGYAVIAFAFITWAALSSLWAPMARPLMSGNVLEGNFSVGATNLMILSATAIGSLAVAGALRTAAAPRTTVIILAALGLQFSLMLASALLAGPALTAIYGDSPQRIAEGAQNLARNANAFALMLPILAAFAANRPGLAGKAVAVGLFIASLFAFKTLDTDAGLFALAGMLAAMGLVALMPRMGFRWLLVGVGAYIAAAPVFVAALIRLLAPMSGSLPASFQSRLWSWEVVIARMTERPFTGHGLDAVKTWRETFSAYPDWLARLPDFWANYPVVPGHPHHMGLHIWAETGFIGAVLAGLAFVALAFRLPRPSALPANVRFAIAGLIGAFVSVFSFSYNVWNEGFWSGAVFAVIALIILARNPAPAA